MKVSLLLINNSIILLQNIFSLPIAKRFGRIRKPHDYYSLSLIWGRPVHRKSACVKYERSLSHILCHLGNASTAVYQLVTVKQAYRKEKTDIFYSLPRKLQTVVDDATAVLTERIYTMSADVLSWLLRSTNCKLRERSASYVGLRWHALQNI